MLKVWEDLDLGDIGQDERLFQDNGLRPGLVLGKIRLERMGMGLLNLMEQESS